MRSSYDPHSEYITWFVQECKVLKIVTWSYVLFLVSFKIYHLVWSVLQYPPGVQSTKNSNMYCMWSYVLFLVPFRISPRLHVGLHGSCMFFLFLLLFLKLSLGSCPTYKFVLRYSFYSADTTLERSCTTSKGQYSWGHELAGPILAPTRTIVFKYVCVIIKYYFYVWKNILFVIVCVLL